MLKILNNSLGITLLDSLNKRISFLNEVIRVNDLENIFAIHGRAEEIGRNSLYREKYDIVVSRAVANMNILLEYMMPLTKVGGICICMKSVNVNNEVENSKNVIKILGGDVEKIEKIYLKNGNNGNFERDIVIIKKKCSTDLVYPRNPSKIKKKPLL